MIASGGYERLGLLGKHMSSSNVGAAAIRTVVAVRDRTVDMPGTPACQHCGGALAEHRPGHPGRPPKYCSVICRQAAHRARRRRSAAQPEQVKRPFRVAMHELAERLRQHTGHLDQRLDRYGAEAQALVDLAVAVRDVAAAHDRTAGDSWTAVARRLDATPAKAHDHYRSGLEWVASVRARTPQ